jgi:hypothetical protein
MKRLLGIGVAVFLCCSVQAAEKLESTEWQWIEVDTVDGHWRTSEGPATVETAGGKLHATLLWHKGDSTPYYDITGSIQMQRPEGGLILGNVTATVKNGPKDVLPLFSIDGTYLKDVFDTEKRKLWGIDSEETITLRTKFEMIGLTRETKIAR